LDSDVEDKEKSRLKRKKIFSDIDEPVPELTIEPKKVSKKTLQHQPTTLPLPTPPELPVDFSCITSSAIQGRLM
jgi:hypothetical protein